MSHRADVATKLRAVKRVFRDGAHGLGLNARGNRRTAANEKKGKKGDCQLRLLIRAMTTFQREHLTEIRTEGALFWQRMGHFRFADYLHFAS